jgi:ferredoxin
MIITKQKSLEDILALVGKGPVFILGCSECATICQTGGESQVLEMKDVFERHNIPVTGWIILDPACHKLNNKRLLKPYKEVLAQTKSLFVLACGNGVQTVSGLFEHLDVIPGTDTLFLGEIKHIDDFEKRCSMCGECLVDIFGGVCPITRCPKAMLNGPCGGVNNGKCEINENLECIWVQSIKILQRKKKQQVLTLIQPPKDWSKAQETKRCI